jgi:hypothetical protein
MLFRCCSDAVQMLFRCCSDAVQQLFSSNVFAIVSGFTV